MFSDHDNPVTAAAAAPAHEAQSEAATNPPEQAQETPSQRAAIGVQRHLQNPVAALHADRLVFGRVLVEVGHQRLR